MNDPEDNKQPTPFPSFLEDFYAESEEHVTAVRAALLKIDAAASAGKAVRQRLFQDLFRSFHSLKGLSGMVGFRSAELLAHEAESCLVRLRSGRAPLTPDVVTALVALTRTLEEVIRARHDGKEEPDVAPAIRAMSAGHPEGAPGGQAPESDQIARLSEEERERAAAALERGANLLRFDFTPAQELSDRGINVNVARARLQQQGELIRTTPHVGADGQVIFSFLLAADRPEDAFLAWAADGITCRRDETIAPADTASAASATPQAPISTPSTMVRVDVSRLDDLMRIVGSLVINRTRLEQGIQDVRRMLPGDEWSLLQESNLSVERLLRELREAVMRIRMVPVGEVFERMRFVARDLSGDLRKPARVEISGQGTEIDKLLVERLMDPLLHLVRNALSHGIEAPEQRAGAGKPPEGLICLRARSEGEEVVIEVEDDGAGIDERQVQSKAVAAGLIGPERVLSSEDLLEILCSPGFSTRTESDLASGRGVGMAVVSKTILELGGSLKLDTSVGRGTRFLIRLPLTLAITQALLVSAGQQRFAVPQANVREVIEVSPSAVKTLARGEMVSLRGAAVPLVRLSRVFGLQESSTEHFHAFVVSTASGPVAIAVDRVTGQREIVVRTIADPLIHTPGVSGATELGDGRPVLILNVEALLRSGRAGAKETPVYV
jgi:two-component system chemotaxis sensor kinase CheA